MLKKTQSALSLFVVLVACAAARAGDPHLAAIENGMPDIAVSGGAPLKFTFSEWMSALAIPGVTVAVVDDFKVVWTRGFGVADANTREPVTPQTLFQAGSIAKPLTAMAALRMVEQGRLALDDPEQATIVCACTGLADLPVDVGYLAHHVRRTAEGSEMRSRFWFGGPHVAGRGGPLAGIQAKLAKTLNRFTDRDARNLLSHCAQEMQHLTAFLPALHAFQAVRTQ